MNNPPKFSVLNDDWIVSEDGCTYESPALSDVHPEQLLLFSDRIRNGSIEADITPLESKKTRNEEPSLEADLVFRYSAADSYYYAGTSAWRTKFFFAAVMRGPYYQLREYVGRSSAVKADKTREGEERMNTIESASGFLSLALLKDMRRPW